MFVTPCIGPRGTILRKQVWNYLIKQSIKMKLINTCYRYPITGKGVQYAKNCSTFVSQHGFNIFLALYIDLVYIIMAADAINSYALAPPPYEPFYVNFGGYYRDGYCAKHGI